MTREMAERDTILRVPAGSTLHGLHIAGTDDRDEVGVCNGGGGAPGGRGSPSGGEMTHIPRRVKKAMRHRRPGALRHWNLVRRFYLRCAHAFLRGETQDDERIRRQPWRRVWP